MAYIRDLLQVICSTILITVLNAMNPLENGPATIGVVTLDSITFNKTISAFPHSFVSFTLSSFTQSLYKLSEEQIQKNAIFNELALTDTLSLCPELLIAQVDVKESPDLAKRFQVEDEKVWPEFMLFKNINFQGCSEPNEVKPKTLNLKESRYGGEISSEAILTFLKGRAGLPLTLPGCLPKFDVLASLFLHSSADERKNVLKDTEKLSKKCCKKNPEKEASAQKYVQLMKSSTDNEENDTEAILRYFFSEENRLKRLLEGKVSDKKKTELQTSINIIQSFKTNVNIQKNKANDEL